MKARYKILIVLLSIIIVAAIPVIMYFIWMSTPIYLSSDEYDFQINKYDHFVCNYYSRNPKGGYITTEDATLLDKFLLFDLIGSFELAKDIPEDGLDRYSDRFLTIEFGNNPISTSIGHSVVEESGDNIIGIRQYWHYSKYSPTANEGSRVFYYADQEKLTRFIEHILAVSQKRRPHLYLE